MIKCSFEISMDKHGLLQSLGRADNGRFVGGLAAPGGAVRNVEITCEIRSIDSVKAITVEVKEPGGSFGGCEGYRPRSPYVVVPRFAAREAPNALKYDIRVPLYCSKGTKQLFIQIARHCVFGLEVKEQTCGSTKWLDVATPPAWPIRSQPCEKGALTTSPAYEWLHAQDLILLDVENAKPEV